MSKFLSLYVDACRSVMRLDLRNVESWTELNKYLPAVRHALMCCVCGRLLDAPMGLDPSICHHYVCRSCVGGKMRYMKGGCGWCKNFDEFVPNAHLSAVVKCFKQLCVYLNGFLVAGIKNNAEVETIAAIVRDAIGDVNMTDGSSHIINDAPNMSETKEIVRCEVPTTSENISVPTKSADETSHTRKRRQVEGISEPSWKRAKRARHGFGRKSKAKGLSETNQPQDEFLTGFENGEASSQLMSWSSNNMHSNARVDDNRSLDEESFLNSSYDPDLLLLENSVLAEHDYNKYTTVSDEAVSSTAMELVSVPHSTKTKRQANSVRRSYSKKLALDQAPPVRKSSLTIRQISERDQLMSSVSTSKAVVVANNNDSTGTKPPSQRRPKSGAIKIKIGCRCAMATPAPGKLTCCGQRCPCYAAFHGCSTSCKCRGCRNPRGDPVHTMPVFNSGIAMKTSTTSDLQSTLPLLFDTNTATFSTAVRDQQQSHLVLHAAKSRFLTETFSCFGSG